jgi:hypothetical protein
MTAAAVGTIGGLYFVVNQDLSHEPSDDTANTRRREDEELPVKESNEKEESSVDKLKDGPGTESQNGKGDAMMGQKKIEKKTDPSQPGAGRPGPGEEAGLVGHGPNESPKARESGEAAPDKSDKVRVNVCVSQVSNAK